VGKVAGREDSEGARRRENERARAREKTERERESERNVVAVRERAMAARRSGPGRLCAGDARFGRLCGIAQTVRKVTMNAGGRGRSSSSLEP
jgi:hypothetical protein